MVGWFFLTIFKKNFIIKLIDTQGVTKQNPWKRTKFSERLIFELKEILLLTFNKILKPSKLNKHYGTI